MKIAYRLIQFFAYWSRSLYIGLFHFFVGLLTFSAFGRLSPELYENLNNFLVGGFSGSVLIISLNSFALSFLYMWSLSFLSEKKYRYLFQMESSEKTVDANRQFLISVMSDFGLTKSLRIMNDLVDKTIAEEQSNLRFDRLGDIADLQQKYEEKIKESEFLNNVIEEKERELREKTNSAIKRDRFLKEKQTELFFMEKTLKEKEEKLLKEMNEFYEYQKSQKEEKDQNKIKNKINKLQKITVSRLSEHRSQSINHQVGGHDIEETDKKSFSLSGYNFQDIVSSVLADMSNEFFARSTAIEMNLNCDDFKVNDKGQTELFVKELLSSSLMMYSDSDKPRKMIVTSHRVKGFYILEVQHYFTGGDSKFFNQIDQDKRGIMFPYKINLITKSLMRSHFSSNNYFYNIHTPKTKENVGHYAKIFFDIERHNSLLSQSKKDKNPLLNL